MQVPAPVATPSQWMGLLDEAPAAIAAIILVVLFLRHNKEISAKMMEVQKAMVEIIRDLALRAKGGGGDG